MQKKKILKKKTSKLIKSKEEKKKPALPKRKLNKISSSKVISRPTKIKRLSLKKSTLKRKKEVIAPLEIQEVPLEVKEETKKAIEEITVQEPKLETTPTAPLIEKPKVLELNFPITLRDLAIKFQQKPSVLIKKLMDKGLIVGINQLLEERLVLDLAKEFGFIIQKEKDIEEQLLDIHRQPSLPEALRKRPPVVTLMGHVDHGKTSLLDAIRRTKIAESEYGGITQHIGAYQVKVRTTLHPDEERKITFLDTPGHEAFTRMRARGAKITDIVILVVASDEGVMPQTIEAIDHAREAGVPIMVAINKIDKPEADVEKVKKQLSEYGLVPEDWQGKTVMVAVSAKTGQGIDELLELIILQAEMMDLKADYQRQAKGAVIESQLSSDKGVVATLLVQNGVLKINDNLVVGLHFGKIKAMFDEYGRRLSEAYPSTPVKILGLSGLPQAGDEFFVVKEERLAKQISLLRQEKRKESTKTIQKITLETISDQLKEGKIKELKIILKADTSGSLEAIKDILEKIKTEKVSINIIHEGIGDINTSDVVLASASKALILGFNVSYEAKAKEIASEEGLEAKLYNVIYELSNDIKLALQGMLQPKIKKIFLGKAEVRKIFKLSKVGVVAGCYVSKGKILRNSEVILKRNDQVVFEGKISSLKRFKDDVREVVEGMECGISLGDFQDIQEEDVIEAYEIQKITPQI
ncbi:MAG: translation initiation factor IF-2 [Candidatus Omnitrophica bacterium]|nr:translation initiation factor IF-2 [Candidatus Omnitrophota bacterium]